MQKKITLGVVLVLIVGAIVYLQNPDLFKQASPASDGNETVSNSNASSSNNNDPNVDLGVIDNPPGDDVGLEVGKALPNFALRNLDGDVVKLSDFRGEKAVIVNLWASWCGPCKVEMPDLEEVYQTHWDDLVVLGVDLQETVEDINTFLEEEVSVTYPILLDDKGEVASAYNKFTQPTSFLVDENGIIQAKKFGAYVKSELEAAVEQLLNPDAVAENENQLGNDTADIGLTGERPVEVVTSNLAGKYFGRGEQAQLGIDVDLANVPHVADLDMSKFLVGCPVVDCIPSIDAPRYETVEETTWMQDDHLIITVDYQGISRAYPTGILNWHEIVNDDFNGTPVVVNYCPLCYSATAFIAPIINGEVAEFGVSGRLLNSDLIMYDRVTGSFWSQIERDVIVGPLTGKAPELEFIPVNMTTWGQWKAANPDGQVLARPTQADPMGAKPARNPDAGPDSFARNYNQYPYQTYPTNDFDIRFPVDIEDRRLNNKDVVIGVEIGEAAKAYPKTTVEEEKIINDTVAGVHIVLVYDEVSGGISVMQRPSSDPLSLEEGVLTDGSARWDWQGDSLDGGDSLTHVTSLPLFWFSWQAFHPNVDLYGTE